TVRIGMDAGVEAVLQLCSSAGIRSPLRPYPATFLGSSEVTLAELAMGYTIFPNGGWRPSTPHILERIEEKDGTLVWDGKQQSIRKIVTKPETAYEVHSCLVDALESGTGKAAYSQFGLKKIPAAGKTGTAYDFTDALFAGYDSALTCAVWGGFDKPQKIYRGAFGRELALPVWVDVMNASAERYPAKQIPQPSTLKKIEICSRSGSLATDKCCDTVKSASGESVQKEAAAKTDIKTTDDGKPILKAIPVEPQDKKPVEIRRAQPVGPLDEVPDDSLLKAATPPPETDLGD